jgi:hypothetical protein
MLGLYGTDYGVGIQTATFYLRTHTRFSVYAGGSHHATAGDPGSGGEVLLTVTASEFKYKGQTVYHEGNQPGVGVMPASSSSGGVTDSSSGITVTRPGSGEYYTVTHDLGQTPSVTVATPVVTSFSTLSVNLATYYIGANSFTIVMSDGAFAVLSGCQFVLFE